MVKAVFLDRDGVINANLVRDGKPVAPTTLDEFRIFPDAAAAAQRLKDAGFLLIVVTNQPDVRTGLTPKATMEAMHAEIRALMPIDDFMICLHTDADNCACRKPKPGLTSASRRQARHRPDGEHHGRRPLARRSGRPGGRVRRTIRIDHGLAEDQPVGAGSNRKVAGRGGRLHSARHELEKFAPDLKTLSPPG